VNFTIEADHPSLAGHFPGHPVVPGVVILSRVFAALCARPNLPRIVGIRRVKFLRQVLPGQRLRLEVEEPMPAGGSSKRVSFECWLDDVLVLSGVASLGAKY